MTPILLLSAVCHPLFLCTAVCAAAYATALDGWRGFAAAILLVAPWLVAAASAAAFQRWCFGERAHMLGAVPTLAGAWTLAAALDDSRFLALAGFAVASPDGGLLPALPVLVHASAIAVMVSATVMMMVLAAELPFRWATSAVGRYEADLLPRGLRWVGVCVLLSAAWYLVTELYAAHVPELAIELGAH